MRKPSASTGVRLARLGAVIGAAATLALFAVVAVRSTAWIGTTFPGFFVLQNRVVPSVSLPAWGAVSLLFQSQVASVDGRRVSSAAEVYEFVAKRPPHTAIEYTLRTSAEQTITASVDSRRFSRSDYALTLGAPLVNGLLFVAIGLTVLWLRPERSASWALISVCATTGVFALTSAGLATSDALFRVHLVAEALMAPAYAHLALVFPTDRIARRRWLWLAALYIPFVSFAAWFCAEAAADPVVYSGAHLAVTGLQGLAVLALLVRSATHLVGRSSPLARRRVGVAALGAVAGLALPSALALASVAFGGRVPVNGGMYTAFLFPLSLAYAVVTRDLFQIDRMLMQAISCGAVVTSAACAYFGVFFALGLLFPAGSMAQWPVAHAALDLGLLFAIAPSLDWVRRGVARLYFHRPLDPERGLRELSRLLVSAHSVEDVAQVAQHTLRDALGAHVSLRLRRPDGGFAGVGKAAQNRAPLDIGYGLLRRLASGESLARYEWDDGGSTSLPGPWSDANLEVLVPLRRGETLVGLLALGPKKSGHAFNAHDLGLLQASSLPVVMALAAASAVRQLEGLNSNLEEQVRSRTLAFEETNRELQDSLRRLREAYQVLERNQVGLLRADRLATLGRLTAGLAHEINTPLAAVMNSLKIVIDLAEEYSESIGDEAVLPEDHREISAELLANARAADAWARRAATFLSRTKTHGRELKGGVRDRFAVGGVVEEVKGLLAHRLHGSGGRIEYVEQPAKVSLVGDQSRLSQVLVNLITNALDAYEDGGVRGGLVRVAATRRGDKIEIQVRDWAGGIPADVLPHIFDELFTTKAPGRGTGLGLWIVRNLVEEGFDGKILVDSVPGRGSCFTAVVPVDGGDEAAPRGDQPAEDLTVAGAGPRRSAAA